MIDTHRDRSGAKVRPARPGGRRQGPSETAGRWIRVALAFLAASFVSVGLWATLAPQGFYDGFPGGGRAWIAGDGPFNAHLVSDTGVGSWPWAPSSSWRRCGRSAGWSRRRRWRR